jgi:hypothetical protein
LDEAKKVVDKLLGNYGEEIIAAWIDRHNSDGKKIDTPFHEVYVNFDQETVPRYMRYIPS